MNGNGLILNEERFYRTLDQIRYALEHKKGIFRHGIKHFLPQWNLPKEMEHQPQQMEPKQPYEASLYLLTRAYCDRMSQSRYLMRRTKETWQSPDRRWIFYPKEVVKAGPEKAEVALKSFFNYALRLSDKMTAGEGYFQNCKTLKKYFSSDPRKIIEGRKIEDIQEDMKELHGIDTISNLIIVEFLDRNLARPLDPENALFKVDRHKARIPVNTNSIAYSDPTRHIHHYTLIAPLEKAYLQYCHDRKLTIEQMVELDAAVWVVGSEGCAKKNYSYCHAHCPLVDDLCISLVEFNDGIKRNGRRMSGSRKGCFIPYENGIRTDIRSNLGQQDLFREF